MNEIDIRDSKLKDNELKAEIVRMVEATQGLVTRPLPDKLIMTKAQFEMLSGEMIGAHDSDGSVIISATERIYITPKNVMDVVVK